MLKEFAWNTFKSTGNIEAYNFYKEIEQKSLTMSQRKTAEEEAAPTND